MLFGCPRTLYPVPRTPQNPPHPVLTRALLMTIMEPYFILGRVPMSQRKQSNTFRMGFNRPGMAGAVMAYHASHNTSSIRLRGRFSGETKACAEGIRLQIS